MNLKKTFMVLVLGFVFVFAGTSEPVHYEPTFSVKKHAATLLKNRIAESGADIAQMAGAMFDGVKVFMEESGFGEDFKDVADTLGNDLSDAYNNASEKMSQVYEEELKDDVELFLGSLKSGFDAFSESMKKNNK